MIPTDEENQAMPKNASKVFLELRGLVYRDEETGMWIGHCLELDIVAEGATPDEAWQNVMSLCRFQVESAMEKGDDWESIFHPAPLEYWKQYFSNPKGRIAEHSDPVR